MKYSLIFLLAFLSTIALSENFQLSQTDEKIGLDINMTYFRNSDGSVVLQAEVYDENEYEAVTDLNFIFYSIGQEENIVLGSAYSNDEAIVELSGIPFDKIYRDQSGQMTFRIAGENEEYAGSFDLSLRHVDFVLNFDIIDSVKVISVQLSGKDESGETVGIEDGEIYFFVPRSFFGELQIGDVWTDEDGYDKMKFPVDIPGDENGNIIVIGRISESDEFGNIEVVETINWGVPVIFDDLTESRNLWSSGANAPISLLILINSLIAATWGVIFYIFYKIYRISKT